jgi:hypothetical protein
MTDPLYTANRRERLRHLAITEENRAALSEIKSVACGWRGCPAQRRLDEFPAGWSNLIAYEASPKKKVVNLGVGKGRPVLDLGRLDWRHDVTLCPEHTQKLAELLYCDPGADPLMSETAGRA